MRWPFRRGDRTANRPGAQNAPASSSAAPVSRSWSALPPIAPTWSTRTPLTAPPTGLVRQPLTREPRRTLRAKPEDGAPEAGRVVGLAAVVVPPRIEARPPVELPDYFRNLPPLRHAAARPIVERPPLTEATPEFVGEPVVPPSHAAPLTPPVPGSPVFPPQAGPRPEPDVEAMTDAGARFREALANLHNSGLPRYVSPSEMSWQAPERAPAPPPPAQLPPPAPRMPQMPPMPVGRPPSLGDEQPRLTHRRNTLAQSRRLGLGAPLRRDEGEQGDGGELESSSDAEPARANLAPSPAAPPPIAPSPPSTIAPPPPEPASPPPPPANEPPPPPAERHPAAQPDAPVQPAPVQPDAPVQRAAPTSAAPAVPPRQALQPVVVPAKPVADGAAHPAASAAPLVFRAQPSKAKLRETIKQQVQRAVVTRPPTELAQALRSSHGIDVADVPVHRDTAAGVEARDLRARAFTRGARVFLPEEAGPVSSAKARGLLAHELVHVAQQRRLGSALPPESTSEGRALEAEAQHAERLYSYESFPEPELVHAPPPVSPQWVESRIVQLAGDPINYFDPYGTLTPTQEEHFHQSAREAAQQAMADYRDRSGGATSFESLSDEEVTEQNFLDVINTELDRLGEPPQAALTPRDRDAVKEMLEKQGRSSSQPQTVAMEVRRDSRTAGGFLDNLFGGRVVDVQVPPASTPTTGGTGRGGGARTPGGGTGTTGGGAGTAGGGAGTTGGGAGALRSGAGGRRAGAGARRGGTGAARGGTGGAAGRTGGRRTGSGQTQGAARTPQTQTVPMEIRRDSRTAGGFLDNLFGGRVVDVEFPTEPAGARAGAAGSTSGAGAQADGAGSTSGTGTGTQVDGSRGAGRLRTVTSQAADEHDVAANDLDLDQLAGRLYDRLRTRLRRELLVDRERSGLLTDYR